MPNWCEGTLKVRGNLKNIKRWVKENLKCYEHKWVRMTDDYSEYMTVEIENAIVDENPDLEEEYCLEITHLAYIKSSRRHFVKPGEYWCMSDEEGLAILELNFQSAWDIDEEPFISMSKAYDIDFRFYGFERGTCFNRELLIENGALVKNEEIKFDNYEWESPFATLGG